MIPSFFQLISFPDSTKIPNKIKTTVSKIMSPKRVAQCLFKSKEYKCSDAEKKEAKIWIAVGSAALITAVTIATAAILGIHYRNAQSAVNAQQVIAASDIPYEKSRIHIDQATKIVLKNLITAYREWSSSRENLEKIAHLENTFNAAYATINYDKQKFDLILSTFLEQEQFPESAIDIFNGVGEAKKIQGKIEQRKLLVLTLMVEYLKFKRNEPSNFKSIYDQVSEEYMGEADKLEIDIQNAAKASNMPHYITLKNIDEAYNNAK